MDMNKGKLRIIDNLERQCSLRTRAGECKTYYSVYLEDSTGKDESTILLTQDEVNKLKTVTLPSVAITHLVPGRLYPFSIGTTKPSYIVKVIHEEFGDYVVQISKRLYEKCLKRASTHPASTPKKGLLEDLFD